ncbi:MAG: transaldolase [Gammaproteobacteria bacterium]|nr:transaldolase [Gammaproteobacteria bacterium]
MEDWARNRVKILREFGQSVWLDDLRRSFVRNGDLARLIEEDGISGVTSTPTNFVQALGADPLYREEILSRHGSGADAKEIYKHLALQDAREAADRLSRVHHRTAGRDGFVCLDISPRPATDADGMIAEARRLWAALGRPNVMIKIPGTRSGLAAVRQLTAEGINVCVTALFGVAQYREAYEAYASGLEARVRQGCPLAPVASVAEIFVSQIDTLVDERLTAISDPGEALQARELLGKAGVDVARFAYQDFKKLTALPRWQVLASSGAAVQRLLWAGTRSPNPTYSDVKYVDELIGEQTIAAASVATLSAYRDHGRPALTLASDVYETAVLPADLRRFRIDVEQVSEEIQAKAIQAWNAAYEVSLAAISAQCGASHD